MARPFDGTSDSFLVGVDLATPDSDVTVLIEQHGDATHRTVLAIGSEAMQRVLRQVAAPGVQTTVLIESKEELKRQQEERDAAIQKQLADAFAAGYKVLYDLRNYDDVLAMRRHTAMRRKVLFKVKSDMDMSHNEACQLGVKLVPYKRRRMYGR